MTAPDHLSPFTPKPSRVLFIGLNVLRALSMIALLLVMSANIVVIAHDANALKADKTSDEAGGTKHIITGNSTVTAVKNSTSSDETWNYGYVPNSTVPSQAMGAFWSILNRIFIILLSILLLFSEIGMPKRIFSYFIPMLGPEHGLGCLGILQTLCVYLTTFNLTCSIAAVVLSAYCELFAQVSSWLLFIVGCFNIIVGIFLRDTARPKRSLFSWENYANLTPQTKLAASVATTTWETVKSFKRDKSAEEASVESPYQHNRYLAQQRDPATISDSARQAATTTILSSPALDSAALVSASKLNVRRRTAVSRSAVLWAPFLGMVSKTY